MMDGRCRISRAWIALIACGMGLPVGCGVVNPSLLATVGDSTTVAMTPPQGYVVILIMNPTTVAVQATVAVADSGRVVTTSTLSVGPLAYFATTYECGISSIQFQSFGYASTAGTVTVNANLGVLTAGQEFNCGQVVAVAATGNPPTFSVRVY